MSFYKYIQREGMFGAINVSSMVITLINIKLWIQVVTENEFTINEDGSAPGSFEYVYNTVEHLQSYRYLSSFNVIVMFINIMRLFTFSSKLSMFYEILQKAIFDIILFLVILFLIICGYALVGHILFGYSDQSFSTYIDSFFSIFLIVVGASSSFDILSYFTLTKTTFGLSLIIISIFLLNMLVAIVGSHFFEHFIEQENVKANFFKLFILSYFGQDNIQSPKETDPFLIKLCLTIKNYMIQWASHIVITDADREDGSVALHPNFPNNKNIINLNALEQMDKMLENENNNKLSLKNNIKSNM